MRSMQRGISYWSVLFIVGLFGFILKVIVVLGPVYLDYFTIDKMLQAKFKDPQVDAFDLKTFKNDLSSALERNGIHGRKVEEFMVVRREGSKVLIDMEYEERHPLVGNVDVIAHFKKSYSSERPEGFSQ